MRPSLISISVKTLAAVLPLVWFSLPRDGRAQGSESISPAFGQALAGGLVVPGKDEYRQRPITVECRAKLESAAAFNVLVACDPKSSSDHWELYSVVGTGRLALYQPGRGGEFQSSFSVCDGKWHQFGAVLAEERVRLYVDGKLVLDRPATPATGTPEPGDLGLGQLADGSFTCDGLVDDIRISRGERQLAASDQPLQSDAQTLGLWNFDGLAVAQATPTPTPVPDDRATLPEYRTIPAARPDELTPANGWPALATYKTWTRSLGGQTSNRYSTLTQINRTSVRNLQVAWTYHSKDGAANIQCNPIVVDDVMYLPTAGNQLAALNAATGEQIWLSKLSAGGVQSMENVPARRGLLYWPGDGKISPRLIVGAGNLIFALDPKTGQPIPTFGQQGHASLPMGATSAGAVWKNVLVMPGYAQDVFGYDVGTGRQLWRFQTIPTSGKFGAETWRGREKAGANDWGGMALDDSRGIAYVATGSPKPNYVGSDHKGDNLFSDCVIALKVETGERLWHFQEIRHDIWDMDIPAPPNLVTVKHDGRMVDAVAQVTKYGNTLLLDRVTGKPLFPFRLRRAPASNLPGEEPAAYQPYLELPEPFAREEFTRADITDRTPAARAFVENQLANAKMGWFETIEEHKPLAYFGVHGGAEWTGASFDPTSGRLYVSTNHMPWIVTAVRDRAAVAPAGPGEQVSAAAAPSAGAKVYLQYCAACHGQDRGGQGMVPPLKNLGAHLKEPEVVLISKEGRNAMPPPPPMADDQRKQLMDFLFDRDQPQQDSASKAPAHFAFDGYNKLLDQQSYPGSRPPWGTLDCIDLNTGKKAWSVPLGEYDELTRAGIPKTGQENFGGPTVTAGGLVFCSGTRDKKIRAFDAASGVELWSAPLPLHGTAPPTTYEAGGRQFIVLAATGGGKLGGPVGDAWVAFSLPKN